LTADVTVNTTLAQVEADAVITSPGSRSSSLKAPVLLESSGLLDYGTPGMVQLFYSRRSAGYERRTGADHRRGPSLWALGRAAGGPRRADRWQ